MHRTLALALGTALALTSVTATPLLAQDGYERIGYGRLVTNDLIGDGRDRWQSGSYASSYVWGRGPWTGELGGFGDVIELRFDAALSGPDNLRTPANGDRLLTGLMRFGLATQFDLGGIETDLAGTVTFVGPETGLVDFQTGLHDQLNSAVSPSKEVRDTQLDLNPTFGATAEFARTYSFGRGNVRPFVSLEAGVETIARVGADLTLGSIGQGGLMARDMVTGHRYRIVDGEGEGFSFVMGADMAHVDHSLLLHEDDGVVAEDERMRARVGLHWQNDGRSFFYGLTRLGPETEFQDGDGQTTGSIRMDWNF
ncbi:lipid A-modifier LpxR family protein [Roseobacteraceae bacterium S113]